jgi:hypothetical protein
VSAEEGKQLAAYRLPSVPVFDGLAAAYGRLFLSSADGSVLCLGPEGKALESITHIGYAVHSVAAEFTPIEIGQR